MLDYDDRATLNEQVAHLHRNAHDVFQLFEFRNERGEMLAIIARAYIGHEIVAQT